MAVVASIPTSAVSKRVSNSSSRSSSISFYPETGWPCLRQDWSWFWLSLALNVRTNWLCYLAAYPVHQDLHPVSLRQHRQLFLFLAQQAVLLAQAAQQLHYRH